MKEGRFIIRAKYGLLKAMCHLGKCQEFWLEGRKSVRAIKN
jgi:hypothetical protein